VGDSIDIFGGFSGPVGMGYVGAEFTIPIIDVAEMSSTKMKIKDNAVFFIQQSIAIG
jgi:hypothetical protein